MTKLTSYITGFALSVALTALPLLLLWAHEAGGHAFLSHEALYALFVAFALLQLGVQLYFFLHVGGEKGPRWNIAVLSFALIVVVILVGGTLWIMHNLSHMQHEAETPFIHGDITPEGSND